jgi:uncharacterized protein (UPF0548 family)
MPLPALERARARLAGEDHSYQPGILSAPTPLGMSNDRLDVIVGGGEPAWERARRAIDEWRPFDLGWAEIVTGGLPPHPGQDVIVQARILGVRFTVASRVLAVHDQDDLESARYGFTYGTLRSHVERGEELFEVWRDHATGEVGYRIHAMAAPGRWYAAVGRAVVDHYRARFRGDSAVAMEHAVRSGG